MEKKNKECEIVKDLLPGYVEKTLRNETNEFVEEHIKDCTSCNDMLAMLKEEKNTDINQDEEIDYLKKYNRKTKILEGIAIMLIGFIIIAWGYKFFTTKYEFAKGEKIYNIIQTAYGNMKELGYNSNYILEIEQIRNGEIIGVSGTDTTKYYYKNGKYKEERIHDRWKEIRLGPVEIKESVKLSDMQESLKAIDENNKEFELIDEDYYGKGPGELYIYEASENHKYMNLNISHYFASNLTQDKSRFRETFPYTHILSEVDLRSCAYLELDVEEYNGRRCYVIRSGKPADCQEIWIDTEEMLVVREVAIPMTRNYKWSKDAVKDEDVEIKSFEEYKQEGYDFGKEDWAKKVLP